MSKITALNPKKGRGNRINIFLDGKFAFSLEVEIATKEGLQVTQELSAAEIESLTKADHLHRCLNAALHYLGYRPRSESELRERLRVRGFDENSIEITVTKLKELEWVNDSTFAQFWKEHRQTFKPRSQWLTRRELKRKGVADDIIEQVVSNINDEENAYRVALKKTRSLSQSDYHSFRRQLGESLRRRGFSYEVINRTLKRLWQDQGE